MERKLVDYLPTVVRGYEEFQAIVAAQQPELERAWEQADRLLDDQFLSTAGEVGLSRWEKILGITPKGTESLDDRRFRVQARLNERLPYTLLRLREILDTLCGVGGSTAMVQDYTLTVRVALTAKGNYTDVASLLERVAPENLVIDFSRLFEPDFSLCLGACTVQTACVEIWPELTSRVEVSGTVGASAGNAARQKVEVWPE